MKKLILVGVFGALLGGCSSTPISLPENISTTPTGMGQSTYIDKINHSFATANPASFEKLKLCAVETFSNESILLQDSAGSFVGAYTGNYYNRANSQQIQGGNIFKYEDKGSLTFVATGNTKTKPQQGGVIVDFVKYDAKVSIKNNTVELVFQNINAAQQNTGAASNSGYRQVGTWSGARAPGVISAIDTLAVKFKNCAS